MKKVKPEARRPRASASANLVGLALAAITAGIRRPTAGVSPLDFYQPNPGGIEDNDRYYRPEPGGTEQP